MTNYFDLPVAQDATGLGILGVLLAIAFPVMVALFIARFRSWFAAIWFIPAFIQTMAYVICKVPAVSSWLTTGGEFANGVLFGFNYAFIPMNAFHYIVVQLIDSFASKVDMISKIVNGELFAFILYDVLFVLFFLIFRRRKHKKVRRYADDF